MVDKRFILAFVLVLVLGIAIRAYTSHLNTFMEPDVFMYFSVAQQTQHNLILTSNLSGFPAHNAFDERQLLIYLPIWFSYLTGSLQASITFLPVIFGAIEMVLVYLVAEEITKEKWAGIMAMLLLAVLVAGIFRNVAGEYRGDSLAPAFALAGMLFLIRGYRKQSIGAKLPEYAAATLAVIGTMLIWNGGVYILIVLACYFVFLILSRVFRTHKQKILLTLTVGLIISITIGGLAYRYVQAKPNSLSMTILELQPFSLNFALAAYGPAFILGFFGIGLMIYQAKKAEKKELENATYVLVALFGIAFVLQLLQVRYEVLLAAPMAIATGIALYWIYKKIDPHGGKSALYLVLLIVLAQGVGAGKEVLTLTPAGGITPQFITAMQWLNSNTPTNSSVLTFWSDGSVVEGIGQRQSYTDSVLGLNITRTTAFARYLYQPPTNQSYILSVNPTFIVARTIWKYEANSIAEEGGLANRSLNGTNLQALINGTAPYSIVYQNNDTIIYEVR